MNKRHFLLNMLALTGIAAGAAALQARAQMSPMPMPFPTITARPTAVAPSASPSASSSPGLMTQLENTVALNFLHNVNTVEVEEGTTSQALVTTSQGMALAQALVTDHQQNEQQVTQLAGQKGVTLATAQPTADAAAADALLSTLTGTALYDQAFMSIEKQDHQDVLRRLQALQVEVTDTDVKNLITQTIPIVEKHIALASGQTASASPSPSASTSESPSPSPSPS